MKIIILFSYFISSPAFASGASVMSFSFMMFIWFGFIGWVVSLIVKHQLEKKEDNVFNRVRKILPITLLASPSFYFESSGAMILPSAASFVISIDPMNIASLISCIIFILLMTLAMYGYKYKKTETMQDFNKRE